MHRTAVLLALLGGASAFAAVPAATGDRATIQQVRDLEWSRAPAAQIAALASPTSVDVDVVVAEALGRLGSTDALAPLVRLEGTSDPAVRAAVAEALGHTPGAAPELRRWLDAEPRQARWASPSKAGGDLRTTLLLALGRQAEPGDVPRLVAALAEPFPGGAAGAEALGRMARRKISGVNAAIPALVAGLTRPDPHMVEACAYAIGRIGLDDASEADLASAAVSATGAPTASARAWLVRAVWNRLNAEQRSALFAASEHDGSAVVRVAALLAVRKGDLSTENVAPYADDPHPWVRASAIVALGALGDDAAAKVLTDHEADASPWEQADIIAALGVAGRPSTAQIAADPARPEPARAAAAETLTDVDSLVRLTADSSAMVRSAAADALSNLKSGLSASDALTLAKSTDPVVRQASIALLAKIEPPKLTGRGPAPKDPAVQTLIAQLRVETDPDALTAGLDMLAERATRHPASVPAHDQTLDDAISRALASKYAYVRASATNLKTVLHLSIKAMPRVADGPWPPLGDVDAIRGAIVQTEHGEFTIQLLPDVAPLAVSNFARLADAHFFDGLVFHRVVPGFVVQTGDPRGDGNGGPGYFVPDEVSDDAYRTGAVGMARSGPDTGGSQWFVTLTSQPHLEGDYTLFGYVTSGMTTVDRVQRGDKIVRVTIERVDGPATADASPTATNPTHPPNPPTIPEVPGE